MRTTGEFDKDGDEIMEGHHLKVDGSQNDFEVVYGDGSPKYNNQTGFILLALNRRVQWNMVAGSRCKIINKIS
jgi:hypothetical protein